MRTSDVSCAVGLLACGFVACSDAVGPEIPGPTRRDVGGARSQDPVAECDDAPDGTPCGEPEGRMHCVFDVCARNACGDGVIAQDEECDDGNENAGDGCSSYCKLENCGNRIVDLAEECDDGNGSAGDGCSARCREERCGNRIVDPQEECDDGNMQDEDACTNSCLVRAGAGGPRDAGLDGGGSPRDAGSDGGGGAAGDAGPDGGDGGGAADAGPDAASTADADAHAHDDGGGATDASVDGGGGGAADSGPDGGAVDAGPASDGGGNVDPRTTDCIACVHSPERCRNYQGSGIDLVANCFENPDPDFSQRCVDAYLCSLSASDGCTDDLTRGPVSCYCGLERSIDDCFSAPGPSTGPVGACVAQWEAATGCPQGDNACVSEKFAQLTLPSGYAVFLTTCTITESECGTACR